MTSDQQWQSAQAMVGREYVSGIYDCAHLAVDVQRELFDRTVVLPTEHRQGRAGQAAQIGAHRNALATRVAEPVHGGPVLITGMDESGQTVWHIGTVLLRRGEVWILHNSRALGGVAMNRLRDFSMRGMHVEGFYTWN